MKFALGDIVRYTNKRDKLDILGEVVGYAKYPYGDPVYYIELFKPESKAYTYRPNFEKNSNPNSKYLPHKFADHMNPRFVQSINPLFSINGRSKNLVSGVLQYDPAQQGEDNDSV